ncbi:MAG: hypothetical protein Q9168_001490 [Polycauliona sp. 1 TL-2023]
MAFSHSPSPALGRLYDTTGWSGESDMYAKDQKLLPFVTVDYVPEKSGQYTEETQITYLTLPKIPLRIRSLSSDLALLGNQFVETLIVLQHLAYRRLFSRPPTSGLQQQQQSDYRVVHIQTDPSVSIQQLSWSLLLRTTWPVEDIPLIFPVALGYWEILVRKPYLDELMVYNSSEYPLIFREPSSLPKGIVGRIAQSRSVAQAKDRWVCGVHMGLLEQYPWNHIMKDTAESMSIHQSDYAIIGSQLYEL